MDLIRTARRLRPGGRSSTIEWLGRAGLIARGTIYLLIGVLALRLAFGHRSQEANQRGALQEVAHRTGGFLLVAVITAGLMAYALWCFAQTAFGEVDEGKKTSARIARFGAGCAYAAFSVTGITVLAGSDSKSQSDQQSSWTAQAMQHTGGRVAVALIGLVVLGIGGYLAYEGVTTKFDKHLMLNQLGKKMARTVVALGVIGSTARGVVLALTGVFVVEAAWHYDPDKAKGIDGALRRLVDATAGRFLLVLAALGLIVFGIYGYAEARWRRTS